MTSATPAIGETVVRHPGSRSRLDREISRVQPIAAPCSRDIGQGTISAAASS